MANPANAAAAQIVRAKRTSAASAPPKILLRQTVTHDVLHSHNEAMHRQAVFAFAVIVCDVVSVFAVAPRLAYSGKVQTEPFHRTLFVLQAGATCGFIVLYAVGALVFHSRRVKKHHEEERVQELRRVNRSLREKQQQVSSGHSSNRSAPGASFGASGRKSSADSSGGSLVVAAGGSPRKRRIAHAASALHIDDPLTVVVQLGLASIVPLAFDFIALANERRYGHLKWVGVLRLLHLLAFRPVFETLDTNLTVPHWIPPMLRNILMLLFNTHYAGCVFWLLARRKNYSAATWVGSHKPELVDMSANAQYLFSLYFSVITASTVGYGDFFPVSKSEVTLMIVYVLCNIFLVANIVGTVSALATMRDTDLAEQRSRIARFDRMLAVEGISEDVALATREYLRLGLRMISFDSRCDVDALPASVRTRIRTERFGAILAGLPLFKGVSSRFIAKTIAIASDDAFVKGLEVSRAGDLATRLCIVLEGVASIEVPATFGTAAAGTASSVDDDDALDDAPTCAVATLTTGACFGAESFACQLTQPWTVLARSLLRVISLNDANRQELEEIFPNDWFKVRQNLLDSTREVKRAAERLIAGTPSDAATAAAVAENTDEAKETGLDDDDDDDDNRGRLHGGGPAYMPSTTFDEAHGVEHLHELGLAVEQPSNLADPTCLTTFAKVAASVAEAIERESSKASHALSALHCHVASTGDDAELARLLDMVPVACVPGDYDRRAPLHLAAAGGHVECVRVLASRGAPVDVVDRFGRTPLQEAVLNGRDEVIAALRSEFGASLGLDEPALANVLCTAASAGDLKLVSRYVEAGADVNAADYDRRNALMLAAATGNAALCGLLLEHGADKAAKDRWGHTAHDEAVSNGHSGTLAEMLKVGK